MDSVTLEEVIEAFKQVKFENNYVIKTKDLTLIQSSLGSPAEIAITLLEGANADDEWLPAIVHTLRGKTLFLEEKDETAKVLEQADHRWTLIKNITNATERATIAQLKNINKQFVNSQIKQIKENKKFYEELARQ